MKLIKRLVAECIGTFVLVFCACGTALFCNNSGHWVATALAFGLVIVAMAYSIGRISGCHINPAVSLGCALTKRMTWKEFFAYVASQIVGAIIGGILIILIAKAAKLNLDGDACNYLIGYSKDAQLTAGNYVSSILLEMFLTAIFVYVILNVTDPKNESVGKKAGIIIGLTLTLVHLVGIRFTGTSVNPARSLGTALANLIFYNGTAAISQVWVFFVGPLLGGALAALVFTLLHKEPKVEE